MAGIRPIRPGGHSFSGDHGLYFPALKYRQIMTRPAPPAALFKTPCPPFAFEDANKRLSLSGNRFSSPEFGQSLHINFDVSAYTVSFLDPMSADDSIRRRSGVSSFAPPDSKFSSRRLICTSALLRATSASSTVSYEPRRTILRA